MDFITLAATNPSNPFMTKTIIRITLTLFAWFAIVILHTAAAQETPYHIDHESVYDFIDELANQQLIEINSAVKPYSRRQIANWLLSAQTSTQLSRRQKKEVDFYLKEFNREINPNKKEGKRFDLFYYNDSLFRITANIIAGIEARQYEELVHHRWNGGEVYGAIGKHIAFYGSLRDNHENKQLTGKQALTQQRGAVYKGYYKKSDYSEARGGVTYSWDWGSVGLHKDHFAWGNNYHGANILSAHQPSTTFISLKAKPTHWLEYNYIHSWLVSEVVDSTRSYGSGYEGRREVYVDKYLAAALFTITPMKNLNFSIGNSIIYADTKFNPSYLIPFLFYKSVDHTYNGSYNNIGHNSQMFFDISSRQIKNLHLYTSVFIDEIYIGQMFNKEKQSNFLSYKIGSRLGNLLPNTSLTVEYTHNNPLAYTHIYPSTSFASNGYGMGHYLRDNAEELYLAIRCKPLRGLDLQLSYTHARKGEEYQKVIDSEDFSGHPEINTEEPRWGLPFIKETLWQKRAVKLSIRYQIINDLFIFAQAEHQDISGSRAADFSLPHELTGNKSFWFGFNFGF